MSKDTAKAFLTGCMNEILTPEQIQQLGVSTCPTCQKPYTGFVDDGSIKEYRISGMCQSCQDSVFGKPDLPNGLPTGKCPNCGNMCYNDEFTCSKSCETSYMRYINKR